MAERITIEARPRTTVGKQAKQLRREGWVPAVIYGQSDSISIQLDNLTLRRTLRSAGRTNLIEIQVDGDQRTVLAREIQRHPTRGDILHVDFYEVNLAKRVMAEAAIVTVGKSAPEEEGDGVTTQLIYSVEIEALPDNLISEIVLDLSRILTPDDVLHVRDLPVPDGVTVLTDPEAPVAKFDYLREEEELEEEEALESLLEPDADEVEVITKGKAEDDEDFEDSEA